MNAVVFENLQHYHDTFHWGFVGRMKLWLLLCSSLNSIKASENMSSFLGLIIQHTYPFRCICQCMEWLHDLAGLYLHIWVLELLQTNIQKCVEKSNPVKFFETVCVALDLQLLMLSIASALQVFLFIPWNDIRNINTCCLSIASGFFIGALELLLCP